jgi:hypothetical protein
MIKAKGRETSQEGFSVDEQPSLAAGSPTALAIDPYETKFSMLAWSLFTP